MGRKGSAYRFAKKSGIGRPGKSTNILAPGTYGGQTTQPQPSTYGLNAANQQLAELGEPIPVLFGNRRDENGGFIHTPSLVYQRMYSQGSYQEVRVGFVVGEGGEELKLPSNRGIRIGKDLLHAKQSEFYQIRFTDGKNDNNQPSYANTNPWGQKYISPDTLDARDRFLVVRDPDNEVRGLSQSFDPGISFGLESEDPDCTQKYDQEFTSLIPFPSNDATPVIKYNPIDASVGNTRYCRTTEFGFAVDLPQPAAVAQDESEIPVGSKWKFDQNYSGGSAYTLCTFSPFYSSQNPSKFLFVPNVLPSFSYLVDGQKAEIISVDTAFYVLYREFYRIYSQEELAPAYSKFVKDYGSKVLFIDPDNIPSAIYASDPEKFTGEDDYKGFFRRIDGLFEGKNYGNVDSCGEPEFDLESLRDPKIPKLLFKLFYRKLDDQDDDWRPVCRQQFCVLSADASTLFASVQVHHPGLREQAYEYRFKASTPLQYETDSQATYERCKYGVKQSSGTTNQQAYVLYPKVQQEQRVNGLDGFKLTFKGLIEDVMSETKLDAQSTSFKVDISYVNEFIKDAQPKYPYMSMGVLELRAGKGVSSLGQLSMFYANGMQINRCDQTEAASDLFGDLVYYLLTQYPGNTPGAVSANQIDLPSFLQANEFTDRRNLRYNGVISVRVGIHEFISEHAKYFLLRFGTNNGRYTLYNAINDSVTDIPTADSTQVVTLDMIQDGSFAIDYASLPERESAKMQVIWRRQDRNMPGVNESVTVQPIGYSGPNKVTHDISGFCTSKEHALIVARFLSAMRQEQDRTVNFTCADSFVDLAPGRLFTFNITVETSTGNTYTNKDQYQVTSRTYLDNGTLSVRAVYMPAGITEKVFTDQAYEEVK